MPATLEEVRLSQMKYNTFVIPATVLNFAFAVVHTLMPTNTTWLDLNPHNSKTFEMERRRIQGRTPYEETRYRLKWITQIMKGFVHEEYIDFEKFIHEDEDLFRDLNQILDYVEKNLPRGTWDSGLGRVTKLYHAFKNAYVVRQRFRNWTCWGSDLVEEMAKLDLRIMAMCSVDEKLLTKKYRLKLALLEFRFSVLKERALKDTNMSNDMKQLCGFHAKVVEESLQVIKAGELENNETNDEPDNYGCPKLSPWLTIS